MFDMMIFILILLCFIIIGMLAYLVVASVKTQFLMLHLQQNQNLCEDYFSITGEKN